MRRDRLHTYSRTGTILVFLLRIRTLQPRNDFRPYCTKDVFVITRRPNSDYGIHRQVYTFITQGLT